MLTPVARQMQMPDSKAKQDAGARRRLEQIRGGLDCACNGLVVRDARRCRAPHHEGLEPHPEEAPTGPRKARPDDKLSAVSKDEATALENA